MHERPHDDSKRGGERHAQPERLANARNYLGAVVEAEKRLNRNRHADERHHREHGDALHDADGGKRALSTDGTRGAVFHQQEVHREVHDCGARLHGKARKAEREDGTDDLRVGAHAVQAKLERCALREDEEPQHRDARCGLADQRGVGRTCDAPAELQNENVIEDGAHHRANHHGQKRAIGGAGCTNKVVHAHADHLQNEAKAQYLDERRSIRAHLVGRAREREEGVKQRRIRRNRGNDDPEHDAERHRVTEADLGIVFTSFAQTQRRKRIAAITDKHRKRHEHNHERSRNRCRRQADFAHGLSKEDGVDQVVRCIHQHAQDSRDGELRDEPGKGRRAHAGNALIALRLARRGFGGGRSTRRSFGGRFQGLATLFFLCRHMHTSCFNRLICHFSETYDCMHISAQEGTVYHAHRAKATASGRRNGKAEDPKQATQNGKHAVEYAR